VTTGLVTFALGRREYATPLTAVREVVRLENLADMPGMEPPLAGVLDLRGTSLPVLDLRVGATADSRGDVLVLERGQSSAEGSVGVAVDRVRWGAFVLSGLGAVLAAARAGGAAVRGSAGVGVAYAAVPAGTPVGEVAAALDRLRQACGRHGGSAVVVDAPAAVKGALDVWGPVPALDLMRRVKDQFDPGHRLAPGRFVGGI
jgi:FAD/FMN-containing dehydrogenase